MIPIFFSGEEFNATFHALPELTPDLYGGRDAGKGRWLYGSMLDWNELNEHGHRDMLRRCEKNDGDPQREYGNSLDVPGRNCAQP